MEAQVSSPPRAYPDPAPSDAEVSDGPAFFQSRRSNQHSLSHEDQTLARSLSHDMNGHMSTMTPRVGSGQSQGFDVGDQPGLPQTPHQPSTDASMAGQHSGMDPNQDLSYGMGSDRRKRSKVSRACDECRRKKVRCDSTTSDGNVIETCSNCRRLKLTCQFERAPMKRGPSKGYIKELAERVQQVESQMGMPVTYRRSLDNGSPPDAYPEPPYSPTEPMSGSRKRTFSQFDGRNPFAPTARTSRDRVVSLGGGSGGGERGSLSLAPDQQLPGVSPTSRMSSIDLTKPFWAQETELEHPKPKSIAGATAPVGDLWQDDSLFSAYMDVIHEEISILPKSFESVQHQVSKCPQPVATAFSHAVAAAVGQKDRNATYVGGSEFDDYVWDNARVPPDSRNISENIVWLWVYALMLVKIDADVARLGGTEKYLAKQTLLKMAVDLGGYLLAIDQKEGEDDSGAGVDAPRTIVLRTWSCIVIFAQLHAIGTGGEDQTDPSHSRSPSVAMDARGLLSEPSACLAAFSGILSLLTSHMSSSDRTRSDSIHSIKTRKIVELFVETVISTFSASFALSALVQQLRSFTSLLLARHSFVNDPSEILALTMELVDHLSTDPVNPRDHQPAIARPLAVHLYTLAGLTLLELVDSGDQDLVKPSQVALVQLHQALEQVSERAHVYQQNQLSEDAESPMELHWADALLRIIDAKGGIDTEHVFARTATNGPEPSGEIQETKQEPSTANGGDEAKESIQVISSQQQYLISRLMQVSTIQKTMRTRTSAVTVVDFSLLTRRGYLNVLADLNGY